MAGVTQKKLSSDQLVAAYSTSIYRVYLFEEKAREEIFVSTRINEVSANSC